MEKVDAENRKPFLRGSPIPGYDLFTTVREGDSSCLIPPACFVISLNERLFKVAQDFSFTFDKVHYSMPRKYLRQELEIRQGKKKSMSITNTVTSSGRISGATHRKTG